MTALAANIKWVMLVAGVLTCSMFLALLAPQSALRSTFGQGLDGPVAEIVVRNWGALIGIGGLLLIYGAFNEPARGVALATTAASKLVFIALVLTYGRQFLGYQAGVAVVGDAIMVVIFAVYLLGGRSAATAGR